MSPAFEQSTPLNGLSFPEDEGTGLTDPDSADFTSAGYFASLAAQSNSSDYVETGLNLENVSGGTFDLTTGLAFILYEGGVDVQDTEGDFTEAWDQPVTFSVLVRNETDISYEEGEVNDVYLKINLDSSNDIDVVVIESGGSPDEPNLKIAEIDDT